MLLNKYLKNYLDNNCFNKHNNIVTTFYKFLELKNYIKFKIIFDNFFSSSNLKGTVLLAKEGINGMVAGSFNDMNVFLKYLLNFDEFKDMKFRFSNTEKNPFLRMKIKIKKEIVTLGLSNVNPKKIVGKHLNVKEWNQLLKEEKSIIIDTRNDYEVSIGTFENSINPKLKSFREFPKWAQENLIDKKISKDLKIGMFCTGGIRCEKSTSYLKKLGFRNVFHLDGGILKYLEDTEKKDDFWRGECFVFDYRVSLKKSLEKGQYDMCYACRMPINKEDQKHLFYKKGKSCHHCFKLLTLNQEKRFKERERQINLSKKRNQNHIGPKNNINN